MTKIFDVEGVLRFGTRDFMLEAETNAARQE
jgi:hypothetical protein